MAIHYYLSIFPMEALIASELKPASFGTYMATGAKKGSAEQIIFIELEGGFGSHFDWSHAEKQCVPHDDGEPKHSVYLSVYRVLEHIPFSQLMRMYLTTRDGRTLQLSKETFKFFPNDRGYYVYHELCPVHPVIVSVLGPEEFGKDLTNSEKKVAVPKIVYTDLKVIDFENPDITGNIGSLYDRKIEHLKSCIASVSGGKDKVNKTLDRTYVESFSFQIIANGIYVSDGEEIVMYPMPGVDEIKRIDYDWGRSALII